MSSASVSLAPPPFRLYRTRPVFPFPEVARHTGKGSIDDPANFVAVDPEPADVVPIRWLGAKYMASGLQKTTSESAPDS